MPSSTVTIRLEPLGQTISVPVGSPLRDALFAYGVEFPCGGRGKCKKCRVRLLTGWLPPAADEVQILSGEDLREGWRLACRAAAVDNVTLEIGQWETTILADDTSFAFTPRPGTGIAVDIGTTTLVAQLLDLETGHVHGVRSALNPQAAYGADVMSRVQFALDPEGGAELTRLIREAVAELIYGLQADDRLAEIVLVGNTVMHHLFCGIGVKPLSRYPFRPDNDGLQTFRAADLSWTLPANPVVQFLPCLGGFVGSDVLAGVLAAGLDQSSKLCALLDLGTNGEIVLGRQGNIVCASTAAGPAFEGGRISMGMRASTGAIAGAEIRGGEIQFQVIGNAPPRGICGSGLVDIVSAGLTQGCIRPSGRFTSGDKQWPLVAGVSLLQQDVRQLQLAKGAVAAGARLLLKAMNSGSPDIAQVYLAGAFGNYVNRESARRIGLVEFPLESVSPAGNTALLGAKLALFRTTPEERDFAALRRTITHVPLADDPDFQDTYVECMTFPENAGPVT